MPYESIKKNNVPPIPVFPCVFPKHLWESFLPPLPPPYPLTQTYYSNTQTRVDPYRNNIDDYIENDYYQATKVDQKSFRKSRNRDYRRAVKIKGGKIITYFYKHPDYLYIAYYRNHIHYKQTIYSKTASARTLSVLAKGTTVLSGEPGSRPSANDWLALAQRRHRRLFRDKVGHGEYRCLEDRNRKRRGTAWNKHVRLQKRRVVRQASRK
jgi:hypothetical protein